MAARSRFFSPSGAGRGSAANATRGEQLAGWILLTLALVVGASHAGREWRSEDYVSTYTDMPRHLMNGVFVSDFASSGVWRPDEALRYAELYFARYPALSLGHHPPLLAVVLVPFIKVMGVTVAAGRLAALMGFLAAVVLVFWLTRRLYGTLAAGWTAAILATHPYFVKFGQEVMSEGLTTALVLGALLLLVRFAESDRRRDFVCFVLLAGASLFGKQLAAFMFPAYAVLLLAWVGWRRFLRRDVLWLTIGGAVITATVVVSTFILSPYNVQLVRYVLTDVSLPEKFSHAMPAIVRDHLGPTLWVLAALGLLAGLAGRDRRLLVPTVWLSSVLGCMTVLIGEYEPSRYAFLALPAFAMLAGSLPAHVHSRAGRALMWLPFAFVIGPAVSTLPNVRPEGATGYETMARLALDTRSPTILYSATVDAGYFVFYARKHAPADGTIILRADKVLTTSFMSRSEVEARVTTAEGIFDVLNRFGTRTIVVEDRPARTPTLDLLLAVLRGDRFIERARVPIVSRDHRLQGVSLVMYEYRDARPPDPEVVLDQQIPLVGRAITSRLGDLLPKP